MKCLSSVRGVKGDDDRLMAELSAIPIGFDQVGGSYSVRYEHTGGGVWQTEEQYRVERRDSRLHPAGMVSSLPPHATLFPLKDGNATMVPESASE